MPADLFDAVRRDDINYVQKLLSAGADVNEQDEQDYAPLHYAAELGHLAITQVLLDRGAVLSIGAQVSYDSFSPLALAARSGHLQIVRLLVEYAQDSNRQPPVPFDVGYCDPLLLAGTGGHTQVAEYLLSQGADHINTWTLAARSADAGPLSLLKTHRQIPQTQLQEALIAAASLSFNSNRIDILATVELLLDCGAAVPDGQFRGRPHISWVAEAGLIETMQLLLRRRGAHHGLWKAVCEGDPELVEALLATERLHAESSGDTADVDGVQFDLDYALLLAAAQNRPTAAVIVQMLISHGACPGGFVTDHEVSPLGAAVLWGNPDTVSVLQSHGAHINDFSKSGHTCLMRLLTRLPIDSVGARRLVSHGADINAMHTSCSALTEAIRLNYAESVRLLLVLGADPNQSGVFGPDRRPCLTPLETVRRFNKDPRIEQLLLHAGATD
jgi:ankyrin repeat protein